MMGTAQVQIAEAIAEIHEAMLVQGEMELEHALGPCGDGNEAAEAVVRKALLASEDAMIVALGALPPVGDRSMSN